MRDLTSASETLPISEKAGLGHAYLTSYAEMVYGFGSLPQTACDDRRFAHPVPQTAQPPITPEFRVTHGPTAS